MLYCIFSQLFLGDIFYDRDQTTFFGAVDVVVVPFAQCIDVRLELISDSGLCNLEKS